MAEELLTSAEVAALLKTTPITIQNWTRRGTIPAIRVNRRIVRYRITDVLAALENDAAAHIQEGK